MKYRYLGGSGLLVSRLSLGTMTFGTPGWGCDEATAHRIMKAYVDGGGNLLDTADVYAAGESERVIGSFLPQIRRDEILIATKSFFPMGGFPNAFGASRAHLVASCEASLRRLKTDYIDLYYLHGPDPVTPLEESLRALDDLTRQGKIRYVGVSNFFGWQVAKAAGIAACRDYGALAAGQFLYNLIHREPEREIVPALVDSRMGLFCYSPLGAGLLAGSYRGMKDPAEGSRLAARMKVDGARFWHPRGFAAAESVAHVAAESGIPMSRLAIGWPLGRTFVTSVIIGVKDAAQLADNIAIGDWDVPQEVWSALEKATRPEEEYLTWFNKVNYARSFGAAEHHDAARELP
ncbi:MAG: aldo/keto reductase [Gemmatimonadales bacterium]|nr:MAG: aldo/keto reductase [Gemmatimonadales bacterium]